MRRTWSEVADTLADLRRKFSALPSPEREIRIAALDEIAQELAHKFTRRSARFVACRFFEVIGLRVRRG